MILAELHGSKLSSSNLYKLPWHSICNSSDEHFYYFVLPRTILTSHTSYYVQSHLTRKLDVARTGKYWMVQVPGTYLQFMQPSAQPRRKYCYLFYVRTTHHARRSKQSFSFSPITQHTIDDHPHHIIEHTRNDHTQLNVIEFQSLIDTKLIRLLLCAIFRYSK